MSYYLHTLTTEKELAVFLIFKKRTNLIFKKTVNIHRFSVEGKTDKTTIIFFYDLRGFAYHLHEP